ncbi:septum site-determining protein MinC [Oceanobacillus halotolerans]|uniref:septum site-determining protein MinC n=1 Tax=Oceanobacillus halotolerans TaxID=2663380 RepID=UPI0013D92C93|nr:septum site-determining protein MinC [Oceanobacillus halotolerans]
MHEKKQAITIKGTRDGLTLLIDDTCSLEAIFKELDEKLGDTQPTNDGKLVSVTVKLGHRYLNKEQKEQLHDIISQKNNLFVQSIDSEVIQREEALAWKEDSEVKTINRIIRSGQVLEITGDLLLIGDVNPGGKVVTTGNIYIMGNLLGIAHAGANGDKDAVIAASYMNPTQLRIADCISRAPDYEAEGVYMECGIIDKETDKIVIDQVQVLSQKRKSLSGFERRMSNG